MLGSIGKALGLGGEVGSTENTPWGPQGEQLKYAFGQARNLYEQGPHEYYNFNTVAGVNPAMRSYMSGMGDYTQTGLDTASMMRNQGANLSTGMDTSMGFYNDAIANYSNPYASVEYNKIMADSVANNPVLQSQIEQGQQDINRNLQENILPSIARSAVATGNVGSTRRGVAEGIAMRGAMEQGSDLATNLQANAYNQAINQADRWAGGEQYGQNYAMSAADRMMAGGQYGSGMTQDAYGLGSQAYMDLLNAGVYERGLEQEQIAADMDRFDFNQNADYDALARYMNIIGGSSWGGTQTQYQDPGNVLAQGLFQLGGAAMMGG